MYSFFEILIGWIVRFLYISCWSWFGYFIINDFILMMLLCICVYVRLDILLNLILFVKFLISCDCKIVLGFWIRWIIFNEGSFLSNLFIEVMGNWMVLYICELVILYCFFKMCKYLLMVFMSVDFIWSFCK